MGKIAAFFDIDGTLYREGLITEVFKKFITHELVDERLWHDEVKPTFMKYDRRQGEYDDYLNKMVDIYKSTLIGLSNEHILHIADTVIKQKGERVYTFTRDEILNHKKEGHLVFAVSGSPLELVEAMARKYEFTDCRGTIYVTDGHGRYTGDVIPMWDHKSKKKAIFFTFISGFSEMIGAILAYLFLAPFITNFVLGIILSMAAGIMIHISIYELLK